MLVLKYIMRGYLYLRYVFHWSTRTGTFGHHRARPLVAGFSREMKNGLKKALFRYHVKQFHESSCSVASVVCVVNALGEKNQGTAWGPVTQQEILERVRTAHWKERMGTNGYQGRRGLPLAVLGQVVKASLDAYGIPYRVVETVQAQRGDAAGSIQKTLLSRLEQFETLGNCLVIAHFDQGSFVQDLNIPHISPVGGFDPLTRQVIILDVDPSQPLPYQIPFDTFYKGISTHYHHVFKHFGYGRGGYVFVLIR